MTVQIPAIATMDTMVRNVSCLIALESYTPTHQHAQVMALAQLQILAAASTHTPDSIALSHFAMVLVQIVPVFVQVMDHAAVSISVLVVLAMLEIIVNYTFVLERI